jgi:hypothetical protein
MPGPLSSLERLNRAAKFALDVIDELLRVF